MVVIWSKIQIKMQGHVLTAVQGGQGGQTKPSCLDRVKPDIC